ncbi:sulfite exporter TauE/SafE family protein [Maribrevibacterium harenarium]|uniref:Probable membrane transporter protein n=1 Tax=Maribrevibacterium harenarium TaxID=2589817 RepID=A0A501WI46_9GAMM|nr:sulfite exporter TauE/SafE family protein [Maribrevibacterium harenarium]TPE49189.1 sulfite exporter TauE/SafE family protein [Maribrevibacterium harenarium]
MTDTLLVMFVAGLLTGFSKFSVGGMGLLVLPIVMIAFPGPEALGAIVPLYLLIDILAVISYRKNISWKVLGRFLPLAMLGVLVGSQVLSDIDPNDFITLLGVIIMAMIGLGFFLDAYPTSFMQKPWAAYSMGFAGGLISMMANAAGPIFSLFLLEQKLSKESYVSTRAWAFFLINLAKLPMYIGIGLITPASLTISAYATPGLLVGALFGYHFLKRVQPNHFKWLVRLLSTIAAVKLILFP